MAVGLAEAGATIILVHRGKTDPSRIKAKLEAINNTKVLTIAAELAENSEVDAILPRALELSPTGKIDVLINNAGISYYYREAELTEDIAWDQVLQVNITSVFRLSRSFGKHWIDNGLKGKIINTASLYSFIGGKFVVPYTASKGAIQSLTQALSNEWAPKGITVNSIVPGYIITDMTQKLVSDPERSNEILKRIPIGRFGDIEDFRGPTVFLASAASDYLSGSAVFVDGGFMGA
jgi:2-deoxy-D-gluconate 3-dehydrogenase